MSRIALWLCLLFLSVFAFADDDEEISPAAPLPASTWQGTYSIDFAKGKLGIITIEVKGKDAPKARYFSVDSKKWKPSELKREQYLASFPKAPEIKVVDFRPAEIHGTTATFKPTYEKCEDAEGGGAPTCNEYSIAIGSRKVELPLKDSCQFGCNVVSADQWGEQLWLGLGAMGEEKPEEIGLQVFDLKTMKRVHRRDGSLPYVIRKDPVENAVWVGGSQGVYRYDKKFKVTRSCMFKDSSLLCR